jgi:uncharacterized protein (DUF362 family)
MNLFDNTVVVNCVESKDYPNQIPFNPPEKYPEYTGTELDPRNQIYAEVRDTFYKLGLDKENFNTPNWNPFKELIKPGMTVFIKPNTVNHDHPENKNIFSVIVHASILRPILDYVCIALNNSGRIIIGDSQIIFGEFDKAMDVSLIEGLLKWYRNQTTIPLDCFDLRIVRGTRSWLYGKWARVPVEQDPRGYQAVDLGDKSCFKGIDPKRLRIAIASYKNMYKYHSGGKHQYVFPKSFLESDVVISIPKLKTHRRTAITLALKNFMGIPALKDCLPHFITGSVKEGGDQYINPSFRKRVCLHLHDIIQSNPFMPVKFVCAITKKLVWDTHKIVSFKDDVYEAMWYGNDTLWRTLLDLNRIVFYADKQGKICNTPQRKFFCLIDGIIGGEKDGPVNPHPVHSGVLMAGFNPVSVDAVASTLMGFDINKIPLVFKAFENRDGVEPLYKGTKNDIKIIDGSETFTLESYSKYRNLKFEPHPSWKGHVEL